VKEHPIETKWLQFRKQNIELIEMAENIYEDKWDEQYGPKNDMVAGIPMGVVESIYALLQFRHKSKEDILEAARKAVVGEQQGHDERMDFLQTFGALVAYRADKVVYHIDRVLFDNLAQTKFPDNFLTSNLVLPSRACVFQVAENAKESVVAYFDATTPRPDQNGGISELCFKLVTFDHILKTFHLNMVFVFKEGETLRQAIENHIEANKQRWVEIEKVREEENEYVSLLNRSEKAIATKAEKYQQFIDKQIVKINGYINCILYAAGNDDTVQGIGHKRKTHKDPKKNKRFKDLAKQDHYEMGTKYRKLIQKFDEEVKKVSGEGEGSRRKQKPHIRSGHSHIYWKNHRTIKSEKIQVVHFLPPIPVGYKWDKETETLTLVDIR